jgi:hypothetical protein
VEERQLAVSARDVRRRREPSRESGARTPVARRAAFPALLAAGLGSGARVGRVSARARGPRAFERLGAQGLQRVRTPARRRSADMPELTADSGGGGLLGRADDVEGFLPGLQRGIAVADRMVGISEAVKGVS